MRSIFCIVSRLVKLRFNYLLMRKTRAYSNKFSILRKPITVNGKEIAGKLLQTSKCEIEEWVKKGNRNPALAIVLLGDHEPSKIYVRNKMRAAELVGISCILHRISDDVTTDYLLKMIENLNRDSSIDGILVQLPLPEHISEHVILDKICVSKDVDGFHSVNIGKLALNLPTFTPCTAGAVAEILRYYRIQTKGKHAVICSRSKNVGLPIAMLLQSDGRYGGFDATTTVCHRYTPREDLLYLLKSADLVISATGIPNLITGDMINEGCCVFDIGMTRIYDQKTGKLKLRGDVDFEDVKRKASIITPVPGGVGPVTVSFLVKNTILAAKSLVGNILH